MKSAYAELIGDFFARGGKVTRLPDGNGLGIPVLRPKAIVGQAKRDRAKRRKVRAMILAALEASREPLTVLGIERATGISCCSLRGAITDLERDNAITGTPGGRGRTRFFRIAAANDGEGRAIA